MAFTFLFGREERKVPSNWVNTSLIPGDAKKLANPDKARHRKGDSATTYGTASLCSDEASQSPSELSYTPEDDSHDNHRIVSSERHSKKPSSTSSRKNGTSECTAFDFLRYSTSEDEDVDLASPSEQPTSTEEKWLGFAPTRNEPARDSNLSQRQIESVKITASTELHGKSSVQSSLLHDDRMTINQSGPMELSRDNEHLLHKRSQSVIERKTIKDHCLPRRTQSMSQAQPVKRKLSWNLETIELNEYVRGRSTSDTQATPTRYFEKAPFHRRHSYNTGPLQKQPYDLNSLRKELDLRKQMHGTQHPKVGEIYNLVGNIHFRCRQYEEAIDAYEKVLLCETGVEEISDYLSIADALGNIGTVYRTTGELDKAIEKLELALKSYIFIEQAQGNNPEKSGRVAATLYNIGLTETLRKKYEKALHRLTQCREIKEEVLGRQHLEVASTIDAIGKAHLGLGNTEEAMTCHLKALEMKKNFSSSLHVSASCVVSLKNIAAVYIVNMDYSAAILKYKEAARVQQSEHARLKMKLGCGKPDVIRLAMETGDTLLKIKKVYVLAGESKKSTRYGKEAHMYFHEAGLKDDDLRMIECRTRSPGIWNSI